MFKALSPYRRRRRKPWWRRKISLFAFALVFVIGAAGYTGGSLSVSPQVALPTAGDAVPVNVGPNPFNTGPARRTSGVTNGIAWQFVQPINDNYAAFKTRFPGAQYDGDIGDASHWADNPHEDHTPDSVRAYKSCMPKHGWIYAQDFGSGPNFDLTKFAQWLLTQVRAGKYPEVKWIITTMPGNAGNPNFYGQFYRQEGWKHHYHGPDHDTHIHISYMMSCGAQFQNMESAPSHIINDYADSLP